MFDSKFAVVFDDGFLPLIVRCVRVPNLSWLSLVYSGGLRFDFRPVRPLLHSCRSLSLLLPLRVSNQRRYPIRRFPESLCLCTFFIKTFDLGEKKKRFP
jgi:hypothetical protein